MIYFANFLLHVTGGDNGGGPWYLEESGFIGLLAGCGFIITWYRKHNCHKAWCWRLQKHPVGDGSLVVCKKHHPVHSGKQITLEHIQHHHMQHQKNLGVYRDGYER